MKKYIIFDFNGTLLDDVDLGLELINEFLYYQNKPLLDMDTYKEIFGFPIKDYYIRAGLDLTRDKFEDLAIIYNDKYKRRSLNANLFDEVLDILSDLKEKGLKLIMLSSTEINNLISQLKYYNIYDFFDAILGTSNYEGTSKVNIGLNYINNNNINKDEIILIGDTLHDYEVSKSIGCDCLLYSKGHMSINNLKKSNATIINNLKELYDYI